MFKMNIVSKTQDVNRGKTQNQKLKL